MSAKMRKEDFPGEVKAEVKQLHDSMQRLKQTLKPLIEDAVTDECAGSDEKNNNDNFSLRSLAKTSFEKAKLDLTVVYTLNSLFWIYLSTKGVNVREHPIKKELDRLKSYMMRAKEVEDKEKAPKLNVNAANRFVRNSLWSSDTPDENEPVKKRCKLT